MDLRVAIEMYNAFLKAKWMCGCSFIHITTALQRKLNGIDVGFIFRLLTAVTLPRARASRNIARALLRIESPALVQKFRANQFVTQLVRTSGDESFPLLIRERARRTRGQLPEVPPLSRMVPNLDTLTGRCSRVTYERRVTKSGRELSMELREWRQSRGRVGRSYRGAYATAAIDARARRTIISLLSPHH